MRTANPPEFAALTRNDQCDVCVVGAGISGLSIAYLLACEGKKVIVLDDGRICSGETERTTAHITNVLDHRYHELERLHGIQNAKLIYESFSAAIDTIEHIVHAEHIDCDFQRLDGYLFGTTRSASDDLEKELYALNRVGFSGVEMVDGLPYPGSKLASCLCFPGQAQFHVLRYLFALANVIASNKGQIFINCHVNKILDGRPARITTTDGHVVEADYVVIATNSPISDRFKIHTKQAAYRTYVIAGPVPKYAITKALYWDTDDPYHYVRLQSGGDAGQEILIVGGEDHRTGQVTDYERPYARLREWSDEWFPFLTEITYRWSGQVYEPVDGLGYIGIDPAHGDNVFISTGSSGVGMTHGTLSGLILRDLILGRKNSWAKLYEPSRKNLLSGLEYAKENVNTALQYTRHFAGGDFRSVGDIPPDHGGIVKVREDTYAVYRDHQGNLHCFSPVCPHLNGRVCWNNLEKTWDCPAHGSRFKATGEVIDGPANTDLMEIDLKKKEAGHRKSSAGEVDIFKQDQRRHP
jgi:glycine/D-amino acid oxidase-like deaminating enzyme/nitrite reductase/ring-hydroxylating ferredoxin subunit